MNNSLAPRRFWLHVTIVLGYTLLALIATWPLATHLATHVPGNGIDDPALAWNLWWIKARLVDHANLDIFHSDWMFHPIDINLAFYTLTPLNGLLSFPLQTFFSLITTSNIILLSSFVLGGYGTFLLMRYLLISQSNAPHTAFPISNISAAAFYAGTIYAFASSKLFYASLGQFNIASSHWIPFCILYVLRAKNRVGSGSFGRENLRDTLLAALFLTFQAWAELTYATFLVIFIVVVFCWESVSTIWGKGPDHSVRLRSSIVRNFVLGGLFLVGISPFLWAMIPDLLSEGDFFTSGGGFADTYSADLMGYFFPTILHPLLGNWVSTFPFEKELAQQIFIGYLPMLLVLIGTFYFWWARRRETSAYLFWLVNLVLFWLLTLGPQIRWGGSETPLPGPFALVSLLPFFNGNRYPSRYSVMVMIAVAILAGYTLFWLLQRWPAPNNLAPDTAASGAKPTKLHWRSVAVVALLVALFFTEHASAPLPLHRSTTPAIYTKLATLPDRGTLLELPTGWRNGARVMGLSDELIMMQQWYQSIHGMPRLGGNTSRNPIYKFQYFLEAPLIGDLISLMSAGAEHAGPIVSQQLDEMIERGREQAPTALDLLDISHVTVHVEKSSPALLRFIDEAMPLTFIEEWQGTDWAGEPSTIRLYSVAAKPPQTAWRVNLAGDAGRIHLAEGWSGLSDGKIRYAVRQETELLLDIPSEGGTLDLTLSGPASRVSLWLAGQELAQLSLTDEATSHSVLIPPDLAVAAIDRLRLNWQGGGVPIADFAPDEAAIERETPIGRTGVYLTSNRSVVAHSAGKDVGDFARVFVDGVDVSPNGLGYNLVALSPDGTILESASFDTLADPAASTAMAAWIRRLPAETLVAGAVRDAADSDFDGLRNLSEEAVTALKMIGVAGDLRRKYRWSHAFVGFVGAPEGSAVESMGLLRPAVANVGSAIVGDRPDGNRVFGGVGQVQFAVGE